MRFLGQIFLLLFFSQSLGSGCAAADESESSDCQRLAEHRFELVTSALPKEMRGRVSAGISKEKGQFVARCQKAPPAGLLARCQLDATTVASFDACSTDVARITRNGGTPER